ncbi:transglutaminase-like domain-containing protein [Paludisphaera mucosa]|uniref:Transglutaminase family protein n=1 Tax=Paludisphaera mucosa TaxID=3030827 RepID=A0ABT6F4A9_9BACT|nr:transglutaminase family protein [Paludisphaera mucosa]MDG3002336.1 transglutaminase family protein [Paludisphaera mucosa]
MFIRIGYDIQFDVPAPIPMMMLLRVHPSVEPALVRPEALAVEPAVAVTDFTDGFGNRSRRILAPAGVLRLTNDAVVEVDGLADPAAPDAQEIPIQELPTEVMPFLLASRYCEVDRLSDIAWNLFGNTPRGWGRVQAIVDWVHNHITFGYQYARWTKTAYDAYIEQQGVCRDFTHLAVAFCRCMNIPARYVTGYLGDIGVPISPDPMDFSAWFEVYLGGRWHTFDARHNRRRIGRLLMAKGRDAVDVAITTSFGPSTLKKFVVWTDEVTDASGETKVHP